MSRVRLLSDQTINQIAAGEVIENPASVVKELIENARDAGARSIVVEIIGGGFQLIRIIDDGAGMERDDALMAFERHATSKLSSVSDLDSLATMGFRGEALASIGAIGKVEMITMREQGTRIVFEGGKLLKVESAGRKRGTTISVRSLFYNVPARQKFQKSAPASQSAILKMVMREALCNPDIAYRLIAGEKELLNVSPSNFTRRITDVFGDNFVNDTVPIEYEDECMAIHGVVGTPSACRSTRSGQHLIVNQRCISCPAIATAVAEAFSTRIESRSFPIFALHITLPPEWIDVNVHPQKREVRLREQEAILSPLRKAIAQTQHLPSPPIPQFSMPPPRAESSGWGSFREEKSFPEITPKFEQPLIETATQMATKPQTVRAMGVVSPYLILPAGEIELPNSTEGGLTLIDLDRARSRLIFDAVLERLEGRSGAMQNLMFPITLEFSADHASLLADNLEGARALGLDIRPFGETTFVVESIVPTLPEESVSSLVDTYIDHIERGQSKSALERETLGKIAARHAVLKGKVYTQVEGERIVAELLSSSSPFQSPFGKPIAVQIDKNGLEKLFSS